jgi:hypothetical protein
MGGGPFRLCLGGGREAGAARCGSECRRARCRRADGLRRCRARRHHIRNPPRGDAGAWHRPRRGGGRGGFQHQRAFPARCLRAACGAALDRRYRRQQLRCQRPDRCDIVAAARRVERAAGRAQPRRRGGAGRKICPGIRRSGAARRAAHAAGAAQCDAGAGAKRRGQARARRPLRRFAPDIAR